MFPLPDIPALLLSAKQLSVCFVISILISLSIRFLIDPFLIAQVSLNILLTFSPLDPLPQSHYTHFGGKCQAILAEKSAFRRKNHEKSGKSLIFAPGVGGLAGGAMGGASGGSHRPSAIGRGGHPPPVLRSSAVRAARPSPSPIRPPSP